MSKQTKPSIVFAHGLWADGSCFGKLIPTLQAEGHEVMASQHGLARARTSSVQRATAPSEIAPLKVLGGRMSAEN